MITTSRELEAVCRRLSHSSCVTVDTEFMRETTYWPRLCVVQMAGPDEAVIIDAMAPNLDLEPFFNLMANTQVMKVFHAARQDIEIIFHRAGLIPHPVFDTQVAAMVCGFGDSVSYDQLVHRLTGARIDKSSRFTDWGRRPLSQRQIEYALADVTHLRDVYQALSTRLDEQGRSEWVREEMGVLTSPSTYRLDPPPPRAAWRPPGRAASPVVSSAP
jgi:ribonuclease D